MISEKHTWLGRTNNYNKQSQITEIIIKNLSKYKL